jgi:hypothetical protein
MGSRRAAAREHTASTVSSAVRFWFEAQSVRNASQTTFRPGSDAPMMVPALGFALGDDHDAKLRSAASRHDCRRPSRYPSRFGNENISRSTTPACSAMNLLRAHHFSTIT